MQKIIPYFFTTIILTIVTSSLNAQSNYYWVGDGGNWSDFSTHWATESGGSTFHTSLPTSIDDVYFDENSFSTSGQTVTLSSGSSSNICHNLDCSDATNSPNISGFSRRIDVYGSLNFSENLNFRGPSLYFYSDEAVDINTAKNTTFYNGTTAYGNLYFQGSGPFALQDSVLSGNIQVTGDAEVDLNSQYIDIYNLTLHSSYSGIFDMSSSEIHTQYFYNYHSATATTEFQLINSSAELYISRQIHSSDSDYNYGDVILEDKGNSIIYTTSGTDALQTYFETLTIEPGVNFSVSGGAVLNMDELIAPGTRDGFINIYSSSEGNTATLSQTSGTVDAEYLILKGITATGGATFNANNSIDEGNNSGWNFTAPVIDDYYWVGDGGDWSDFSTHWATESGGVIFHSSPPSKLDNVYFDENSFSSIGQTVSLNSNNSSNNCRNLDCSGVTNSPTISGFSRRVNVYGSLNFSENLNLQGASFYFYSDEAVDINTAKNTTFYNGITTYGNLYFQGSGPFVFQDSVLSGNIQVTGDAEIDLNGQYIDITNLILHSSYSGVFDMSSSETHTQNFYNYHSPSATTEFQLINTSAELYVSDRFHSSDSDYNYGHVILEDKGYTIEYTTSGTDALQTYFETLTIEPGVNFSVSNGAILNMDELIAHGTRNDLINIYASTEGNTTTFSQLSGIVDAEYLTLKGITATGGATFNANNSADEGNNSGWNFTTPVIGDYYWVGGSGSLNDYENHWATTSGGTTFYTNEPSKFDNVYFDENSFNATSIVYGSNTKISSRNMDWSGITHSVKLSTANHHSSIIEVYGNLTLSELLDLSLLETKLDLKSDEATDIYTKNIDWGFSGSGGLNFAGNGPFTLQDSIKRASTITFNSDTYVDFNKQYVDASSIFYNSSFKGTIDMSSSKVHVNYLYNYNYESSEDFTLITNDALTHVSSGFISGDSDYNYGNVVFENEGNEITFDYTQGTTCNFDTITMHSGVTVEIESGVNWNVKHLIGNGTRTNLITIRSDESTSDPITITQAVGSVNTSYLDLKNIQATGGATFNADFSIDNGNNTGWNFTDLPPLGYYWVGNTGDWSDVSHWATSSGGTEFHTTTPTRIDLVHFDENSFTEAGHSVTLDISAECLTMDWSEATNNPQFISSSSTILLDIYGSVYLTEDMDFNSFNSYFNLYANTAADISMSANTTLKTSTRLNFNGTGVFTFQSSVLSGRIDTYNTAEIDFNGQYIDVYSINIDDSYAGIFDWSTSDIHVDYFYDYQFSSTVQMDLISDQSNFYISRYFLWSSSGAYNYGHVILEDEGNVIKFENYYTGSPVLNLNQLTIEAGVDLSLDENLNIYLAILNAQGTRNEPISIATFSAGSTSTFQIPSGTVNGTYLNLQDIHATGGAIFNASFSTDIDNNDGWFFSPAPEVSYYWIGGSGNWSDTDHWATSSGGSQTHASTPTSFDNVVFDENSFTTVDQEVLLDIAATSKDLDWSDATYSPKFISNSGSTSMSIHGSLAFNKDIDLSEFNSFLNFYASDSVFISTANNTTFNSSSRMTFYGEGSYTLIDNLSYAYIYFYEGVDFYLNEQSLNATYLSFLDEYSGKFDMSSTEVHADYLYVNYRADFELITDNSELYVSRSIAYNNIFSYINLGNVTLANSGGIVSYASNYSRGAVFDTLTIESGTDFNIRNGITLFMDVLIAKGTVSEPISIYSSATGVQAYISSPTGEINVGNVVLKDIHAVGGATFNASNSTDNGNNTGWNFTTDVTAPTFSVSPVLSTTEGTYITMDAALNETGNIYYVIQDVSVSSAPTAEQVFSGLDADDKLASIAGSFDVLASNTTFQQNIAGLEPLTSYQLYIVAEDIVFNQQVSPVNIGFTTVQGTQTLDLEEIEEKRFGDASFALTATSSAELPITMASSNTSILSVSGTTATINGVGTVTITVSQAGNALYYAAEESFEFTVGKRVLQITADNVEKSYAESNPTFTYHYSGFLNSDSESDLTTLPTINAIEEGLDAQQYPIVLTGGSDESYDITLVNGIFTVNKATLDISIVVEKTYGEANPDLTIAFDGFANGEDSSVLDETVLASTAVDESSDVGVYDIQITGGNDNNYDLAVVNNTITINKAPLTITASNLEKTYYDENPDLEVVYSGFVNSEDESYLNESVVLDTDAIVSSNTGVYPISVSIGEDDNYAIDLTNGVLTIKKAVLTLTTTNLKKEYGDVNPSLQGSFEYSGFVNDEDESVLDEVPTLSLDTDEESNAGVYPISITGEDNNYSFFSQGNLTINKAPLSASISSSSRDYGQNNPTFDVTYIGFVNDDSEEDLNPNIYPNTVANIGSSVGMYEVYFNSINDSNYEITSTRGVLTINKATVSVSINDSESTYGATPEFLINYDGFINEDNEDDLDDAIDVITDANATNNTGQYEVMLAGGFDTNYTINLATNSAIHTISKATLRASIDNAQKVYGQENPIFSITYDGFVNADTDTDLDETPAFVTITTVTSDVGDYEITLSETLDNNYSIALANPGVLTVEKAILTATGDNQTRYTDSENPEFTISYDGFVNDDTAADLNELPTANSTAIASSRANDYIISLSGGSDNNYSLTLISGILSVLDTENQSIIFESIEDQQFGNDSFELIAFSTSSLSISFISSDKSIVSIDGTEATILGTGNVTITAMQEGNDQYEAALEVQQDFTINKGSQTITFEEIANRSLSDGAFDLVASSDSDLPVSFVILSGIATLEGTLLTLENTGNITIEATQEGNDNYEAATTVSQSFEVTELVTGLESQALGIKVYPNPVSDQLNINLEHHQNATIKLFDLGGNLMLTQTIDEQSSTIQMSHLSSGIYFISISNKMNEFEERKMIIKN